MLQIDSTVNVALPEGRVGRLQEGLVSEEGGAGCGCFILQVCGDVLGRGAPEDFQSFLQHLLPALQRFQHSVTQRRAHRQIYVKWKQAHTNKEKIGLV